MGGPLVARKGDQTRPYDRRPWALWTTTVKSGGLCGEGGPDRPAAARPPLGLHADRALALESREDVLQVARLDANAALAAAIDADTTVAVPKASNAFEVGVIGLLNIVPAAAGGLPAVVGAVAAAREQTFEALNLPIPVTGPTVMPNGLVQVATLGAIRVGEAIIFPAFNDVLQATVGVPNAVAQELAVSGDPARAIAAGASTAVGSVSAAANVVSQSVVTAATDIRNAAGQQPLGNVISSTQKTFNKKPQPHQHRQTRG